MKHARTRKGSRMKPFAMESSMRTIGGAFYPTGYAVLMLGPHEDLDDVSRKLEEAGFDGRRLMHLSPQTVMREIGKMEGESDLPLPSVGTEGKTVARFVELARKGHQGLMVPAPEDEDTERLMQALQGVSIAYGQKYHMLAIEDLT